MKLTGYIVKINIIRSNGEEAVETIFAETSKETAAVNLALDACKTAYPGSEQIVWSFALPTSGEVPVSGQAGDVYGVWFVD